MPEDKAAELRAEIDRLAAQLGVSPVPVETSTRKPDDLYFFIDADGLYHFVYFERGQLRFDRTGSLDDALYWFCQYAVHRLGDDMHERRERFLFHYQVLSYYKPEWGKRHVCELAAGFRRWDRPEHIELLPDIGEPL